MQTGFSNHRCRHDFSSHINLAGHGELLLRQTTAGSQLLELFAETLNRAHGTLKRLSFHISAKESPLGFLAHGKRK